MRQFLRSSQSQSSSSSSSGSSQSPYHSAASKRLGKQPVTPSPLSSQSSSYPPSSPSSREGTPALVNIIARRLTHVFPEAPDESNEGLRFEINWDRVYKGHNYLPAEWLGYWVINKRLLLSGAVRSMIYNYGADLVF
ncbi:hypothetical protein K469DRAFT_711007 [Zopfia rhizophila CBS 207.26]|uniref:Uncharacterized protein n=1 Tax=Zopfia rhizophila CBS 207.26 TaxID=1314779 RepID=A0A6A6DXX1_9PEZI|nr:hypothetical protein K469DRAFT_711007 [Zopfia rhizophila CBS 207.26]